MKKGTRQKNGKDEKKEGEEDAPDSKKRVRAPIQLSPEWTELAERLANLNRQPMTWYIQGLLAVEADKHGEKRPRLRWEPK